jgi:hypothetical protein
MKDCDSRRSQIGGGLSYGDQYRLGRRENREVVRRSGKFWSHNNNTELYTLHSEDRHACMQIVVEESPYVWDKMRTSMYMSEK